MWKGVIITGASKGLGRAIATSVATTMKGPVHFVLNGRNSSELEQTRSLVESMRNNNDSKTKVTLILGDLSEIPLLDNISSQLFDSFDAAENLDEIYLIHNAGSLGPLMDVGFPPYDANQIKSSIDLNVTAFMILTSQFIHRFHNTSYHPTCQEGTIVNISSLAAIQAFESWSVYCAGKAGREMFLQGVVREQQLREERNPSCKKLRVLNYAPGPLDTDMQKEIREIETVDKALQAVFVQMEQDHTLVSPDASADKLTKLLVEKTFTTGQHVDYFDK